MDSYFIEKSGENTDSYDSCDKIYQSYDFSDENLANIPHTDDNSYSQAFDCDEIQLPPPPGTCDHSPLPPSSYFKKNTSPSPDSTASPSYQLPEDDLPMTLNTANIPIPDRYSCQIKNISLPPPPPPSIPPPLPQLPLPNTPPEEKEWKVDQEINAGFTENEKILGSPDVSDQKMMDDSKYSPSKVESDEEGQESAVSKPKVLGKEAAKKRLMAFSLSKQPSKKNKVTPVKSSKEKTSNPSKSSNVQDVFRTTISEIEAEKRKMFKNMPSHLLSELGELAKPSSVITPSNLETHKIENEEPNVKDTPAKEEASSSNLNEISTKVEEAVKKSRSKSPHRNKRSPSKTKRSRSRSRSNRRNRSRSKRRRRSRSRSRRRRRSRSRSVTNQSRNRKRSSSRSRRRRRSDSRSRRRSYSRNRKRSVSQNRSCSDEKTKGDYYMSYLEDWKSFKAAGYVVQVESEDPRTDSKEWRKLKQPVIDWSSTITRPLNYFRPTFNLLKKKTRPLASLRVTPADPDNKIQMLYAEKTIRYTKTRPIIHWAENPSQTTDYYMSKDQLLENSDEVAVRILLSIIESGKKTPAQSFEDPLPLKSRSWYPRENYFSLNYGDSNSEELDDSKKLSGGINESVELTSKKEMKQVDKPDNKHKLESKEELKFEKENKDDKEENEGHISRERRADSGCDSFLSDEDDKKKPSETVVENIKMELDVGSNTVRIRSRWDSDFDGETSGKEANNCKEESMEISSSDDEEKMSSLLVKENSDVKNERSNKHDIFPHKVVQDSGNLLKSNIHGPAQSSVPGVLSNSPAGNLVSEYEEFLKMVSFDSCGAEEVQPQEKHSERPLVDASLNETKSTKVDKPTGVEKGFRVQTTDWDQESDREEKSNVKKIDFDKNETHRKFSSVADENIDSKTKKNKKNTVVKKKNGKMKLKKKKLSKKSSKAKKKNYRDSSSSDSSSESSDSDSDTDSDESHSLKKKKRKITKEKKKSKRDSSRDSESDESYDGKGKKKKTKKKKKKGKKRKSSTSDTDEVHNALMKQLDFNKQLIMKKIEEIDYISEKSGRKGKENQQKRKDKQNLEESEILDKYIKAGKKKKGEGKIEKDKIKGSSKKSESQGKGKKGKFKKGKSSSENESDSEDSDGSVKKKKTKKERKRKRSSSESSSSEEKTPKANKIQNKLQKISDVKGFKTKEKKDKLKKVKKLKKKKKRESSSSESDSEKPVKKDKKGKKSEDHGSKDWKDSFLLNEPTFKASENRSEWEGKELDWKSGGNKIFEGGKKGDDWEESSSVEESPPKVVKRESSWDEEDSSVRTKTGLNNDLLGEKEIVKNGEKNNLERSERGDGDEKSSSGLFEGTDQQVSDSLKTSMSNFSYNENSFCAFGQELSRDFFLMEPTFSNSAQLPPEKTKEAIVIEPRPFQSVSKSSDAKKSGGSELYSPGYTESEASDAETNAKTVRIVDNSNACSESREEVYDPLNCESESSAGNDIELGSIPLPRVSDILLPEEPKSVSKEPVPTSLPEKRSQSRSEEKVRESGNDPSGVVSAPDSTSKFGFVPVTISDYSSACILKEKLSTTTKTGVISMKGQRKLKSKAAAVFQDESDEEFEVADKVKQAQNEVVDNLKGKIVDSIDVTKNRGVDNKDKIDPIAKEEVREKKTGKELERARSMERSEEKERRNSEKKDYSFVIGKVPSPRKTEMIPSLKLISPNKEKSEIKSDCFEIEPLNSYTDSTDVEETIQRIPVVTGLGGASGGSWSRSHLTAYSEYPEVSASVMNNADSFDLYTVHDSKYRNQSYDKDFMTNDVSPISNEKPSHRSDRNRKEKRKSRSRSLSPRKRRKSKSPRGRSPRKRSPSPKRRDRSPYSPRRRSPKRKSYRSSRSPDRRRKSRSRSPRKRRNDSGRRSRSLSPRKHRSPKRRNDSPRRESFSPRRSISPRKDSRFNHHYSDSLQKRIPVIGASSDDVYMEISPQTISSPRLERDYPGYMNESSRTVSEMNDGFYNRDYGDEFGIPSYSEEVSLNNLITVKNHDIGKPNSPERLSLDQRIELELAGQSQNEQYPMQNQFPEMGSTHFPSSYNSENTNSGESFYQNSEVSSQYFNGRQQQSNYGQFPPYTNSQGVKSSVLQVGNIVEVVPTLQHPPPSLPSKPQQILQVGNVLQVVPSPKVVPPPQAVPPPETQNYGSPSPMAPVVKTQKATAVVAPSSIVPTPNPEAVINPLIKAIQLEREKRRKEKEKRKAEREARRKARQLRREAKLMSVNEKLKKSVQDEGLMLGQEVEDDELLDSSDIPSPPIPVEIITVSSQSTLPPAGKGILITAGFMPKPPSEKKEVKFADGVCPGEGTSTSGGEDIASPPPKPKLPKEKRYKKKKTKVKKKVKVQIIRQIIQDEDDDEDDDLSPPPPPPGDPPPVFFARFPFVGDAQFPIYQTQTTTTTLTTVQYPAPSFQ